MTKSDQYLRITDHPQWERNPFVEKAIKEIDRVTTTRMQFVNPTNRDIKKAIINRQGEVEGETAFLRFIKKDEQQFAKVYVDQVTLWAGLNKAGANVFSYVLAQLKKDSDTFIFKMEDCLHHTGYQTKKPVYKGLADLIENGIIARTKYEFEYFINPLIAFNGNRVTFATTYVRSRQFDLFEKSEEANPLQIEKKDNKE